MSSIKYAASVINGNDWKAPATGRKNGLCLSGGGSRALSAGLGQLIGLKDIKSATGKSLLDSVDYISSVSGGTWLTSIFSFSLNSNLEDLLGVYSAPNTLTEKNIGDLPAGSIGHVPSRLSYSSMIDAVHHNIGLLNIARYPEVRKWIWPVIIGEQVLKPYQLYQGTMEGSGKNTTPMPARFFSLSDSYLHKNIKPLSGDGTENASLTNDDFYFCATERPFPIMNTNIKLDYQLSDSALLPVQGTPIAMGAQGKVSQSNTSLTANGAVQSFAFSSSWQSQTTDTATVGVERRYSLVDLVASSSAFFAQAVGKEVVKTAAAFALGNDTSTAKENASFQDVEASILADLSSLVPQYNFWPAAEQATHNKNTGFADGGNLDNTGLLGMLARSDATNIVVCYNSETALGKQEDIIIDGYDKKVALISTDIPILFGFQPQPVKGKYIPFSARTPGNLAYLKAAQVFEPKDFGPLVTALFAASNGQTSPTVARTTSLTVCDNPAAGITNRGSVDVLWLYNNYAEAWTDEIKYSSEELYESIKHTRDWPMSNYYNFPNYNTALQVELNATQVNALAQFQAWIIDQVKDDIYDMYNE